MPRPSVVVLVAVILAPPGALLGQSRVSQLVDSARVQLAANHLDSAEALLRSALDTAGPVAPADRNNALVWDGIVQFLRGHEDLARAACSGGMSRGLCRSRRSSIRPGTRSRRPWKSCQRPIPA